VNESSFVSWYIIGHFGAESTGNHLHWYWQLKMNKRK